MTAQDVTRVTGPAQHWIAGRWVDSGEHHDSVDPATGEVIGSYAMGGAEEAEHAIQAAKQAFTETRWKTDRALRARVLNRMADNFAARSDELVDVLGAENGKVKAHGRLEVSIVPETPAVQRRAGAHRRGSHQSDHGRRPRPRGAPTGWSGGDHRPVELAGGAGHPLAGPGAGRGRDDGHEPAQSDRADKSPDVADHLRHRRAAGRGWSTSSPGAGSPVTRWCAHPTSRSSASPAAPPPARPFRPPPQSTSSVSALNSATRRP